MAGKIHPTIKNTFFGLSAGVNTTGDLNTAIGYQALFSNTTGGSNTAIGNDALFSNTTGIGNVAIGDQSLVYNMTGHYNVAIGHGSGTNSSYNNTINIGNQGRFNGASNQVFIGNGSTSWIGGYKPWAVYSDARMKTAVKEDIKGLAFIMKLKPVSYYQKLDDILAVTRNKMEADFPEKHQVDNMRMNGFLAQEVEQAARDAGYSFSSVSKVKSINEAYSLSYETFVVPLVKAVQEQQIIIEQQNKRLKELEERILAMEEKK